MTNSTKNGSNSQRSLLLLLSVIVASGIVFSLTVMAIKMSPFRWFVEYKQIRPLDYFEVGNSRNMIVSELGYKNDFVKYLEWYDELYCKMDGERYSRILGYSSARYLEDTPEYTVRVWPFVPYIPCADNDEPIAGKTCRIESNQKAYLITGDVKIDLFKGQAFTACVGAKSSCPQKYNALRCPYLRYEAEQ